MKWGVLILLLALIPSVYAECCTTTLLTSDFCDETNLLHQGKCTSNEVFVLEYNPLVKKYSLIKTFEDGNEFLKIGETKLNAKILKSITLTPNSNERLQLDLQNKTIFFNGMENNATGFLTRYGVRADTLGNIDIPPAAYVAKVDITVRNNKTSVDIKQGTKKDISLTNTKLNSLKDTGFVYVSSTFNAAERLSLSNLYLDSGSFYGSRPEPFIEAEKASYLFMFEDDLSLPNLSSSSPFKISFLDKDAYIYEISPPDKVLLSFDKNINFRRDGENFDNKWTWTVSSGTQRLTLGVNAKNIKLPSGCIEFPLSFATVCPRQINKSEVTQLNVSIKKISLNNLTADVMEINSNKLIHIMPNKMLTKIFLVNDVGYRKLVLAEEVKAAANISNITEETNQTNISQQPIILKPKFFLKKYLTLRNFKFILYAVFLVVGIITLRRYIKKQMQDK